MSAFEQQPEQRRTGTSDDIDAVVPTHSFIVPANKVSGLMGEGDTLSGLEALERLFPAETEAPFGMQRVKLSRGEFAIVPEQVMLYGNGDLDEGTRRLSAFFDVAADGGRPAPQSKSAFDV